MLPRATDSAAPSAPVVIAAPADAGSAAQDGLARVSWARTVWRLAARPDLHPWSASWRLGSPGPLVLVAAALGLLALLLAAGCTTVVPQSGLQTAAFEAPGPGVRCESVLVSREVQIPPAGEVADVRLTIRDLPQLSGKLRVLVRRFGHAAGTV